MRISRISLSLHGAFEMALGLTAMAAPFALGFPAAGVVACFVAGVVLVGLALGLTDVRAAIAAHRIYDTGLTFGVAVGAIALAVAGLWGAAAFLAALALVHLALTVATRYTATA